MAFLRQTTEFFIHFLSALVIYTLGYNAYNDFQSCLLSAEEGFYTEYLEFRRQNGAEYLKVKKSINGLKTGFFL